MANAQKERGDSEITKLEKIALGLANEFTVIPTRQQVSPELKKAIDGALGSAADCIKIGAEIDRKIGLSAQQKKSRQDKERELLQTDIGVLRSKLEVIGSANIAGKEARYKLYVDEINKELGLAEKEAARGDMESAQKLFRGAQEKIRGLSEILHTVRELYDHGFSQDIIDATNRGITYIGTKNKERTALLLAAAHSLVENSQTLQTNQGKELGDALIGYAKALARPESTFEAKDYAQIKDSIVKISGACGELAIDRRKNAAAVFEFESMKSEQLLTESILPEKFAAEIRATIADMKEIAGKLNDPAKATSVTDDEMRRVAKRAVEAQKIAGEISEITPQNREQYTQAGTEALVGLRNGVSAEVYSLLEFAKQEIRDHLGPHFAVYRKELVSGITEAAQGQSSESQKLATAISKSLSTEITKIAKDNPELASIGKELTTLSDTPSKIRPVDIERGREALRIAGSMKAALSKGRRPKDSDEVPEINTLYQRAFKFLGAQPDLENARLSTTLAERYVKSDKATREEIVNVSKTLEHDQTTALAYIDISRQTDEIQKPRPGRAGVNREIVEELGIIKHQIAEGSVEEIKREGAKIVSELPSSPLLQQQIAQIIAVKGGSAADAVDYLAQIRGVENQGRKVHALLTLAEVAKDNSKESREIFSLAFNAIKAGKLEDGRLLQDAAIACLSMKDSKQRMELAEVAGNYYQGKEQDVNRGIIGIYHARSSYNITERGVKANAEAYFDLAIIAAKGKYEQEAAFVLDMAVGYARLGSLGSGISADEKEQRAKAMSFVESQLGDYRKAHLPEAGKNEMGTSIAVAIVNGTSIAEKLGDGDRTKGLAALNELIHANEGLLRPLADLEFFVMARGILGTDQKQADSIDQGFTRANAALMKKASEAEKKGNKEGSDYYTIQAALISAAYFREGVSKAIEIRNHGREEIDKAVELNDKLVSLGMQVAAEKDDKKKAQLTTEFSKVRADALEHAATGNALLESAERTIDGLKTFAASSKLDTVHRELGRSELVIGINTFIAYGTGHDADLLGRIIGEKPPPRERVEELRSQGVAAASVGKRAVGEQQMVKQMRDQGIASATVAIHDRNIQNMRGMIQRIIDSTKDDQLRNQYQADLKASGNDFALLKALLSDLGGAASITNMEFDSGSGKYEPVYDAEKYETSYHGVVGLYSTERFAAASGLVGRTQTEMRVGYIGLTNRINIHSLSLEQLYQGQHGQQFLSTTDPSPELINEVIQHLPKDKRQEYLSILAGIEERSGPNGGGGGAKEARRKLLSQLEQFNTAGSEERRRLGLPTRSVVDEVTSRHAMEYDGEAFTARWKEAREFIRNGDVRGAGVVAGDIEQDMRVGVSAQTSANKASEKRFTAFSERKEDEGREVARRSALNAGMPPSTKKERAEAQHLLDDDLRIINNAGMRKQLALRDAAFRWDNAKDAVIETGELLEVNATFVSDLLDNIPDEKLSPEKRREYAELRSLVANAKNTELNEQANKAFERMLKDGLVLDAVKRTSSGIISPSEKAQIAAMGQEAETERRVGNINGQIAVAEMLIDEKTRCISNYFRDSKQRDEKSEKTREEYEHLGLHARGTAMANLDAAGRISSLIRAVTSRERDRDFWDVAKENRTLTLPQVLESTGDPKIFASALSSQQSFAEALGSINSDIMAIKSSYLVVDNKKEARTRYEGIAERKTELDLLSLGLVRTGKNLEFRKPAGKQEQEVLDGAKREFALLMEELDGVTYQIERSWASDDQQKYLARVGNRIYDAHKAAMIIARNDAPTEAERVTLAREFYPQSAFVKGKDGAIEDSDHETKTYHEKMVKWQGRENIAIGGAKLLGFGAAFMSGGWVAVLAGLAGGIEGGIGAEEYYESKGGFESMDRSQKLYFGYRVTSAMLNAVLPIAGEGLQIARGVGGAGEEFLTMERALDYSGKALIAGGAIEGVVEIPEMLRNVRAGRMAGEEAVFSIVQMMLQPMQVGLHAHRMARGRSTGIIEYRSRSQQIVEGLLFGTPLDSAQSHQMAMEYAELNKAKAKLSMQEREVFNQYSEIHVEHFGIEIPPAQQVAIVSDYLRARKDGSVSSFDEFVRPRIEQMEVTVAAEKEGVGVANTELVGDFTSRLIAIDKAHSIASEKGDDGKTRGISEAEGATFGLVKEDVEFVNALAATHIPDKELGVRIAVYSAAQSRVRAEQRAGNIIKEARNIHQAYVEFQNGTLTKERENELGLTDNDLSFIHRLGAEVSLNKTEPNMVAQHIAERAGQKVSEKEQAIEGGESVARINREAISRVSVIADVYKQQETKGKLTIEEGTEKGLSTRETDFVNQLLAAKKEGEVDVERSISEFARRNAYTSLFDAEFSLGMEGLPQEKLGRAAQIAEGYKLIVEGGLDKKELANALQRLGIGKNEADLFNSLIERQMTPETAARYIIGYAKAAEGDAAQESRTPEKKFTKLREAAKRTRETIPKREAAPETPAQMRFRANELTTQASTLRHERRYAEAAKIEAEVVALRKAAKNIDLETKWSGTKEEIDNRIRQAVKEPKKADALVARAHDLVEAYHAVESNVGNKKMLMEDYRLTSNEVDYLLARKKFGRADVIADVVALALDPNLATIGALGNQLSVLSNKAVKGNTLKYFNYLITEMDGAVASIKSRAEKLPVGSHERTSLEAKIASLERIKKDARDAGMGRSLYHAVKESAVLLKEVLRSAREDVGFYSDIYAAYRTMHNQVQQGVALVDALSPSHRLVSETTPIGVLVFDGAKTWQKNGLGYGGENYGEHDRTHMGFEVGDLGLKIYFEAAKRFKESNPEVFATLQTAEGDEVVMIIPGQVLGENPQAVIDSYNSRFQKTLETVAQDMGIIRDSPLFDAIVGVNAHGGVVEVSNNGTDFKLAGAAKSHDNLTGALTDLEVEDGLHRLTQREGGIEAATQVRRFVLEVTATKPQSELHALAVENTRRVDARESNLTPDAYGTFRIGFERNNEIREGVLFEDGLERSIQRLAESNGKGVTHVQHSVSGPSVINQMGHPVTDNLTGHFQDALHAEFAARGLNGIDIYTDGPMTFAFNFTKPVDRQIFSEAVGAAGKRFAQTMKTNGVGGIENAVASSAFVSPEKVKGKVSEVHEGITQEREYTQKERAEIAGKIAKSTARNNITKDLFNYHPVVRGAELRLNAIIADAHLYYTTAHGESVPSHVEHSVLRELFTERGQLMVDPKLMGAVEKVHSKKWIRTPEDLLNYLRAENVPEKSIEHFLDLLGFKRNISVAQEVAAAHPEDAFRMEMPGDDSEPLVLAATGTDDITPIYLSAAALEGSEVATKPCTNQTLESAVARKSDEVARVARVIEAVASGRLNILEVPPEYRAAVSDMELGDQTGNQGAVDERGMIAVNKAEEIIYQRKRDILEAEILESKPTEEAANEARTLHGMLHGQDVDKKRYDQDKGSRNLMADMESLDRVNEIKTDYVTKGMEERKAEAKALLEVSRSQEQKPPSAVAAKPSAELTDSQKRNREMLGIDPEYREALARGDSARAEDIARRIESSDTQLAGVNEVSTPKEGHTKKEIMELADSLIGKTRSDAIDAINAITNGDMGLFHTLFNMYSESDPGIRERIAEDHARAGVERERYEAERAADVVRTPQEIMDQEVSVIAEIESKQGFAPGSLTEKYQRMGGGSKAKVDLISDLGIGVDHFRREENRIQTGEENLAELERKVGALPADHIGRPTLEKDLAGVREELGKMKSAHDSRVMGIFDLLLRGNIESQIGNLNGFEGGKIKDIFVHGGIRGVYEVRMEMPDGSKRNTFVKLEDLEPANWGKQIAEAEGLLGPTIHSGYSYDNGIRYNDPQTGRKVSGRQEYGIMEDIHELARGREIVVTLSDGSAVNAREGAARKIRLSDGREETAIPLSVAMLQNEAFAHPDGFDEGDTRNPAIIEMHNLTKTPEGTKKLFDAFLSYIEMSRRAGLIDRFPRNTAIVLVRKEDGELAVTFQPIDCDFIAGRIIGEPGKPVFGLFNKDFAGSVVDFVQQLASSTGEDKTTLLMEMKAAVLSYQMAPDSPRVRVYIEHDVIMPSDRRPFGVGYNVHSGDSPQIGDHMYSGGRSMAIVDRYGRHSMHAPEIIRIMEQLQQPARVDEFKATVIAEIQQAATGKVKPLAPPKPADVQPKVGKTAQSQPVKGGTQPLADEAQVTQLAPPIKGGTQTPPKPAEVVKPVVKERHQKQQERFEAEAFDEEATVRELVSFLNTKKDRGIERLVPKLVKQDKTTQDRVREEVLRRTGNNEVNVQVYDMTLRVNRKYRPVAEVDSYVRGRADLASKEEINIDPEVMKRGEDERVFAHGIARDKGGVHTLTNIILEGRINKGQVGLLTTQMGVEISSGSHGPYFVIVPEGTMNPSGKLGESKPIDEQIHIAYVVPNEHERNRIAGALSLAVEKGLMTKAEAEGALGKIITYREFVDAPPNSFKKPGISETRKDKGIELLRQAGMGREVAQAYDSGQGNPDIAAIMDRDKVDSFRATMTYLQQNKDLISPTRHANAAKDYTDFITLVGAIAQGRIGHALDHPIPESLSPQQAKEVAEIRKNLATGMNINDAAKAAVAKRGLKGREIVAIMEAITQGKSIAEAINSALLQSPPSSPEQLGATAHRVYEVSERARVGYDTTQEFETLGLDERCAVNYLHAVGPYVDKTTQLQTAEKIGRAVERKGLREPLPEVNENRAKQLEGLAERMDAAEKAGDRNALDSVRRELASGPVSPAEAMLFGKFLLEKRTGGKVDSVPQTQRSVETSNLQWDTPRVNAIVDQAAAGVTVLDGVNYQVISNLNKNPEFIRARGIGDRAAQLRIAGEELVNVLKGSSPPPEGGPQGSREGQALGQGEARHTGTTDSAEGTRGLQRDELARKLSEPLELANMAKAILLGNRNAIEQVQQLSPDDPIRKGVEELTKNTPFGIAARSADPEVFQRYVDMFGARKLRTATDAIKASARDAEPVRIAVGDEVVDPRGQTKLAGVEVGKGKTTLGGKEAVVEPKTSQELIALVDIVRTGKKIGTDKELNKILERLAKFEKGDMRVEKIAKEWEHAQEKREAQQVEAEAENVAALNAIDLLFRQVVEGTQNRIFESLSIDGSAKAAIVDAYRKGGVEKAREEFQKQTRLKRDTPKFDEFGRMALRDKQISEALVSEEPGQPIIDMATKRGKDPKQFQRELKHAYEVAGVEGILDVSIGFPAGIDTHTKTKISETRKEVAETTPEIAELLVTGGLEGHLQTLLGDANLTISAIDSISGSTGSHVGAYIIDLSDGRRVFVKEDDLEPSRFGARLLAAEGLVDVSETLNTFDMKTGTNDGKVVTKKFGISEDVHDFKGHNTRIRLPNGDFVEGRVESVAMASHEILSNPELRENILSDERDPRHNAVEQFTRMLKTAEGREEIFKAWAAYHQMSVNAMVIDRATRNTAVFIIKTADGTEHLTFQPIDTDWVAGHVESEPNGSINIVQFTADFAIGSEGLVKEVADMLNKQGLSVTKKDLAVELIKATEKIGITDTPEIRRQVDQIIDDQDGRVYGLTMPDSRIGNLREHGGWKVIQDRNGHMLVDAADMKQKSHHIADRGIEISKQILLTYFGIKFRIDTSVFDIIPHSED